MLVQAKLRWDLKNHIKGIGETHLKDQILILIQLNSPRLHQSLWGEDIVESKKRKSQKGGARFRRKPRLVDKIAEGVAMGLSGPSPSFIKLGAFLGKQALKGIKDNVQHYRRRK